jgi:hypothetical protein
MIEQLQIRDSVFSKLESSEWTYEVPSESIELVLLLVYARVK